VDVNLRCISPQAARECAAFLLDNGLTDVTVTDRVVHVPRLSPRTVISIAEAALANGWADDDDAARIIAEMG
jgi:hypothetical protein